MHQGGLFTWARRGDKASENPYKCWNKGKFPIVISYIKGTKKAKSPNAFYFLKFIIFTEQLGDDFALSQIELRIDAVEKDTLGLK